MNLEEIKNQGAYKELKREIKGRLHRMRNILEIPERYEGPAYLYELRCMSAELQKITGEVLVLAETLAGLEKGEKHGN